MSKKIRVAVLLGGKSSENIISKKTGTAVINALRTNKKYEIRRFDPAENYEELITALQKNEIDIVFNALHGTHSEDGEIQGDLKKFNIPVTGPNILAAATCFDKITTKRILRAEKFPVADDICFERINNLWHIGFHTKCQKYESVSKYPLSDDHFWETFDGFYSFPLFLKAAQEGSSNGVYKVKTKEELKEKFELLEKTHNRILIEVPFTGVEATVGNVFGKYLPIIEIWSKDHLFYDYESKYAIGGSDHFLPPKNIDASAQEKIIQELESIPYLFDINSPFRIDIFVDGQDYGIVEINTLPGMTETSLLPEAYKSLGYSFEELCEEIIEKTISLYK